MDQTLLTILIKDVAIPEILALLHRHVQDSGGSLTVKLSKDVADVKAFGQAFLDETRPPA